MGKFGEFSPAQYDATRTQLRLRDTDTLSRQGFIYHEVVQNNEFSNMLQLPTYVNVPDADPIQPTFRVKQTGQSNYVFNDGSALFVDQKGNDGIQNYTSAFHEYGGNGDDRARWIEQAGDNNRLTIHAIKGRTAENVNQNGNNNKIDYQLGYGDDTLWMHGTHNSGHIDLGDGDDLVSLDSANQDNLKIDLGKGKNVAFFNGKRSDYQFNYTPLGKEKGVWQIRQYGKDGELLPGSVRLVNAQEFRFGNIQGDPEHSFSPREMQAYSEKQAEEFETYVSPKELEP